MQLDEASYARKINWQWVRGHAGNEGNEKADELANKGVNSMMDKL
jgi:ribonuclease HI